MTGTGADLGLISDRDERRRAEELVSRLLHESEATLRAILDASSESIWLFRSDGTVLAANQTAVERWGSDPVVGRRVQDLEPRDLMASRAAKVAEAAQHARMVEFEDQRAGRTYRHTCYPVSSPTGPVDRVAVFSRDVTDQRAAEESLRRTAAALRRYELLASTSRDIILFVRHDDGRILDANAAALAAYGYEHDEFLSRSIGDLQWPAGGGLAAGYPDPGDQGVVFEAEHRRRNGQTFPVEVSARATTVDDIRMVVAIVRDVTERRQAELARRESEEQFRALADNAHDAICRLDADGRFLYVNPFYANLVGLPADVILGRTARDIGREPGPEGATSTCVREVLDTKRARRFDWQSVEGRWWDVEYIPETHGGTETVLSIARDVTDRKRAEEALRQANARLEEADRRKNDFLAVLSHELRNPLTPIHTGLHLIERLPAGSEAAAHAIDVVQRQTHQLMHLVDDLLDVTRISRNKIRLQRQPLDVAPLVRRTVEDHRALLDERGVRLEVSMPAAPLAIDGDAARVSQVVGNLLQNAAKFTPRGGRVSVTVAQQSEMVAIEVADTGAGLEPALVQQLFEPFAQADRTLDRTRGGLGLGLALVKTLVEMHGGRVSARSDGPGRGSTFAVHLPLAAVDLPPAAPSPPSAPGPGLRVLVVEDNRDAAEMMSTLLELNGHDVCVAHDGVAGLDAAVRFEPDVVLCDIGLPGMDGLEVARRLRSDPRTGDVALVALTGYALEEDLRRTGDAGFDRHLAKPATPDAIERVLAELVGLRRKRPGGDERAAP